MNNKIRFEETNCDFCGSKRYELILNAKDHYNGIPGKFTVVKCSDCGLVYTNPRPTKNSMSFFYPDSAGYFIPTVTLDRGGFKKKREDILLREYYGYFPKIKRHILTKMILSLFYLWTYRELKISGLPHFVKNGSILDIGCSYGGFLSKMKKLGWKVKGIELNKKSAEWGKRNFGLEILNTDIDHFKTNEKFDVITMGMLLEHVYSPKKVLKKVKNLLKPNGILIMSLPNFGGFEAKLYGKYAYTLHVPNHLTHFTPSTIKRYLILAGFKNIKIYYQKVDRDFIAPLRYMHEDGKNMDFLFKILSNRLIRKTFVKLFINMISILHRTSRMTVYAYK